MSDDLVNRLREIGGDTDGAKFSHHAACVIEDQSAELTRFRERNVELETLCDRVSVESLRLASRIASLEATVGELREALSLINSWIPYGKNEEAICSNFPGHTMRRLKSIKLHELRYALAASESVVRKSEGENDGK